MILLNKYRKKNNMKKIIITLTILGLFPFYLNKLDFLHLKYSQINFELAKLIYGAIIISFLSGMQWQRFIIQNETSIVKLVIPMLITLWGWSFILNFWINGHFIIIIGLILTLLVDLFIQRDFLTDWFIKLRVCVTCISVLSFLI